MNLQASIRIPRRAKDGETGDGIVNTVISYAKSESGTTPPSTGWASTLPTPTQGWYLWTRTVTTYRIRPATTTYSVSRYGEDGTDGADGDDGKDGKDGASVEFGFRLSDTNSAPAKPTGALPNASWTYTMPLMTTSNRYLWITKRTKAQGSSTWSVWDTPVLHAYLPKDGEDGQGIPGTPGLPGQIPIQKEWVVGDTHRNTDEIVDYIYARGDDKNTSYWYKLASKGTIPDVEAPPSDGTTPPGYERIDWLKELAVNVLLAEEANLAGFIFKGGQLISVRGTVGGVAADYSGQAGFVPNLILDGTKGDVKIIGTVNAKSGSIGGWSIDGLGIRSEVGSGAYIKVEESGGRFIRINENPNSAMVSIRTDNGTGVRIYTQQIDGVGLSISGQTGARAINSYGSHEFYQRPSETWNAPGMLMALTLELRRMAQVGFSTNIFEHKWHISSLNGLIASRENGDVVRLTHNLGHTDYTPHATLNAGGGEVDKIVSYSNYFDMYLAGSWNYSSHRIQITVIGRNKI